ncbi:hypothetical protein B0H14DRAFT_3136807 [Mycena olivaceomarginata]|nr:hypothetical protein B0H14DRAFT_3136807 [Mycena olivaceomarginata]
MFFNVFYIPNLYLFRVELSLVGDAPERGGELSQFFGRNSESVRFLTVTKGTKRMANVRATPWQMPWQMSVPRRSNTMKPQSWHLPAVLLLRPAGLKVEATDHDGLEAEEEWSSLMPMGNGFGFVRLGSQGLPFEQSIYHQLHCLSGHLWHGKQVAGAWGTAHAPLFKLPPPSYSLQRGHHARARVYVQDFEEYQHLRLLQHGSRSHLRRLD